MNKKIIYLKNKKNKYYIKSILNLELLNFINNGSNKIFIYTLNIGIDETFFFAELSKLNAAGKMVLDNFKDLSRLSLYFYCPSLYLVSFL